MKFSTILLFIAVFGIAASKWTGADEMCKDDGTEKKEEEKALTDEEKEAAKAQIKCADWTGVYFMMKGMIHFHESVCGTDAPAEVDTAMSDLDDMKPDAATNVTKCGRKCPNAWVKVDPLLPLKLLLLLPPDSSSPKNSVSLRKCNLSKP